jgi:tetratricopeptide (TPR) repeat protein
MRTLISVILVSLGLGLFALHESRAIKFASDKPEEVAERGTPVVSAIYKYRSEKGLWPYSLADLSPDYLPAQRSAGWVYRWDEDGFWQLTAFAGASDWAVRFAPKGNKVGWVVVADGVNEALLKVNPPAPPLAVNAKEVAVARRQELARRVTAYPRHIVHARVLFSTLVRDGQLAAAQKVCDSCLKVRPDHWWPVLAAAECEAKQGKLSSAVHRLRQWVGKSDDLAHGYLFIEFLLRHGRNEEALSELKRSTSRPLAHLFPSNDAGTLAYGANTFAWQLGLAAYRGGHYDIALAICDQWEEFDEKHGDVTPGYLPLRAATRLAVGDFEEASTSLAQVHKYRDRNYGWNKRLDGLGMAIKKRDTSFRYDPGLRVDTPSIYREYE